MKFFQLLLKQNKSVIIITLVFGIIYGLISVVNHYNFRTNAGDLGIYNQAIFDYAHFRFNYNTLWFGVRVERMLTAHFALLQVLFAPLYWIFKSYTLIIVQILSILFGGIGVYKYIKEISKNEKLSLLALIHFFSIWGIYSALSYDYHDNVLSAMLVPWLIYFFKKEKYRLTLLFYVLFIISRENMALWAGFLAIGLLFVNYKNAKRRYILVGATVFSFFFFFLIINYIMPALAIQPDTAYLHFKFPPLGHNFKEAIMNIFKHPWDIFVALFTNHLNNPSAVGVKNEFFLTLLLSGGVILLRKPQYLIALLPIFGQKLFHDTYLHWGLSYHYSIEFAPILTIALFEYFSEKQNRHILKYATVAVIACFTINIVKIENRLPGWYNNVPIRFYAKEHYITPYSVKEIQKALSQIPKKAKVSAEFNLAPHLAARRKIYEYPKVFDAEYIVLCPGDDISYPLSQQDYELKLKKLLNSYRWEPLVKSRSVMLFRKNENAIPPENDIKQQQEIIKKNQGWLEELYNQASEREQSVEETIRKNAIFMLNKKEDL